MVMMIIVIIIIIIIIIILNVLCQCKHLKVKKKPSVIPVAKVKHTQTV